MAKDRDAANAVMYGVEQVCGLYGVDILRMQSRVFTVVGKAGRNRPMFIGQWTDRIGNKHTSGMADFLARPRVPCCYLIDIHSDAVPPAFGNPAAVAGAYPIPHSCSAARKITVPVWIECKSGEGKLSGEQELFKQHVEANGEYHIAVCNSLDPLMAWLDKMGVRK